MTENGLTSFRTVLQVEKTTRIELHTDSMPDRWPVSPAMTNHSSSSCSCRKTVCSSIFVIASPELKPVAFSPEFIGCRAVAHHFPVQQPAGGRKAENGVMALLRNKSDFIKSDGANEIRCRPNADFFTTTWVTVSSHISTAPPTLDRCQ